MTEFENFEISREQAREFARAIYADIAEYIENHHKEYEQFLEQENNIKNIEEEIK